MNNWTGNKIRDKWISFFESKGHYLVESKSLVPLNDPSLLWINAGVATLKNYFSGKSIPPAPRLVNSQRCLRTNDIENVGVTSRHQTLFEMMGNFAIGDYFKKEAIEFAWELLLKEYQLQKDLLYITVYEEDDDAYNHWIEVGVDPSHITRCNRSRNFWDLGQGPCGPCTEIYYDRGEKYDPNKVGVKLFLDDIENDRYVEIWNIVFSQFNNDGANNYTELARKNIDTGMGLERMASVLQDVPTNFDTDLFLPIIREIEKFSDKKYVVEDYFSSDEQKHKTQISFRVITDHIKASVFAIADGVMPGSKDRNYIIRRLIRRSLVHANRLNIHERFFEIVVNKIIEVYGDFFPYLKSQSKLITETLVTEEIAFEKTIKNGLEIFSEAVNEKQLDGQKLFRLVETYGFPIELIKELALENAIELQWDEFDRLFTEHKEISKASNEVIAIEKQNANLINFKTPSTFDYYNTRIKAKVVGLFDDQFNPTDKITNDNGYVIFDKTVIYASSGGQRYDEGYAKKMFNPIVKFDFIAKAPHLQHLHHFVNASFKVGQTWTVWHDPDWRRLTRKNHSLEHILHAALKRVISPTIKQEGAFKSAEKATLDFTHPTRLTDEQLTKIENEIRDVIAQKIPVEVIETDLEGANKLNAIAYFDDEYKRHDKLRVIKMSDYSVELCGGTHVNSTDEIEDCYIISHNSRGVGSWRIEIISSHETIEKYLKKQISEMKKQLADVNKEIEEFKISDPKLLAAINDFKLPADIQQLREKQHEWSIINDDFRKAKVDIMKQQAVAEASELKAKFLKAIVDNKSVNIVNNVNHKEINIALSEAANESKDTLFVVFNQDEAKTHYFAAIKNPTSECDANQVITLLNKQYSGKGGGKNNFAQGGTGSLLNENEILTDLKQLLK